MRGRPANGSLGLPGSETTADEDAPRVRDGIAGQRAVVPAPDIILLPDTVFVFAPRSVAAPAVPPRQFAAVDVPLAPRHKDGMSAESFPNPAVEFHSPTVRLPR
jgi:hypothetical protein